MGTRNESAHQENLKRLRRLIASGRGVPRRSKLLPGESYIDYQRKQQQAFNAGISEPEFEWGRLLQNGWNLEDERVHREHARLIGYDLYGIWVRDSNGTRRKVGYDLVDEGDRLVREGRFPGMNNREPGSDDEEAA